MQFEEYLRAQFPSGAAPLSVLGSTPGEPPTLRPQDLPTFAEDGGCQTYRRRRISELEEEIASLRRELDSQAAVDAIVERTLQISFEEEPHA